MSEARDTTTTNHWTASENAGIDVAKPATLKKTTRPPNVTDENADAPMRQDERLNWILKI